MSNTPDITPTTLESIAQQKEALLKQIRSQKEIMTNITREIFAPVAPATNKANTIMRAVNTGMAAFDGALMGLKLMRKIRHFFYKKRK